jgi:hypothetical protein
MFYQAGKLSYDFRGFSAVEIPGFLLTGYYLLKKAGRCEIIIKRERDYGIKS